MLYIFHSFLKSISLALKMSPIGSIELDLCFLSSVKMFAFSLGYSIHSYFISLLSWSQIYDYHFNFWLLLILIFWSFLSLSPSFVNEGFQGSIWFPLIIYFKFYFLSDYIRTRRIHINLSALLHICTHLTTERIIINLLVSSELNWKEWMNLVQMTIILTSVGKNPIQVMEEPI